MNEIIKNIEAAQLKAEAPEFCVGDTVKVYAKIKEGNRERIQVFEGTVIKRQNGGVRETFTVRKSSNGVGVEKTSPDGPNALPGVTRTPAFSNKSFTNSSESVNPAGIGAHTNIVPSGFSIFQPMDASPSHRQSRRLSYAALVEATQLWSPLIAAIAAF